MKCPKCHKKINSVNAKVLETRSRADGTSIRRRRECCHCKKRFTTREYTVSDLHDMLEIDNSGNISNVKINFALEDIKTAQENLNTVQKELQRLEQLPIKKKKRSLIQLEATGRRNTRKSNEIEQVTEFSE